MNITPPPVRSTDRDRLEYHVPAPPAAGARPSLADRASLRLGLWLLLRSTRNVRRNARHDTRSLLLANERAREVRESHAAREQLLSWVRA